MSCIREKWHGAVLDGRFELLAPLNHGSFGMVTLAKDLSTGENVAVKCMTKTSSGQLSDEKSEELASHEVLGDHSNVVSLIKSFETEHHVYLVLEYCSMGDLYEAIRSGRGPKETDNVRDFMVQLVDAVEYVHSKGLAHRDIKPENIFLTSNGDLKLGDFGLSTRETWTTENAVGSDRYMAPEQYDASAGYCPAKADIWAVGVCLLNLLFSRNPFAVPNESDPLFADYVRDRQSLFDVFPTMSQDTFEVLIHAMAIDPEKRSLDAVRVALNRVLSFTTDDEVLDDFCTETPEVALARPNREPLRTPSISSPQVALGQSFPWAEALHKTPATFVRELSNISDHASYSEDLFAPSEHIESDWVSVAPQTPSTESILSRGFDTYKMGRSAPVNIAASAPAPPLPSLAAVFGGKRDEVVSKSWSELFDDEQEEVEEEREREEALRKRRAQNARSWSQESADERTVRLDALRPLEMGAWRAPPKPTVAVHDHDLFVFEDHHTPVAAPRTDMAQKWAALGDRRRAVASPPPKDTLSANASALALSKAISSRPLSPMHTPPASRTKSFWRKPFDALGDVEWVGGWRWGDLSARF